MPKGSIVLTYDEKLALVQNAKPIADSDDGFVAMPEKTGLVGAKAIEWELQFPLDAFRRNPGLGKAVLDGTGDDKKDEALTRSIKNRLMSVNPTESWSCIMLGGSVILSFAGTRKLKTRKVNA